ncbi:hypothetical protein KIPB_009231, partial [Kipferlia bialata]|eukprot:g9231.t1
MWSYTRSKQEPVFTEDTTLKEHLGVVGSIDWSDDGSQIVSVGSDNIVMWKKEGSKWHSEIVYLADLTAVNRASWCRAKIAERKRILVATHKDVYVLSYKEKVAMWATLSEKETATTPTLCASFHPTGSCFAYGTLGGVVGVSSRSYNPKFDGEVDTLPFGLSGKKKREKSKDKAKKEKVKMLEIQVPNRYILDTAFSPSGDVLVYATSGSEVGCIDSQPRDEFSQPEPSTLSLTSLPAARMLFIGEYDWTLLLGCFDGTVHVLRRPHTPGCTQWTADKEPLAPTESAAASPAAPARSGQSSRMSDMLARFQQAELRTQDTGSNGGSPLLKKTDR